MNLTIVILVIIERAKKLKSKIYNIVITTKKFLSFIYANCIIKPKRVFTHLPK